MYVLPTQAALHSPSVLQNGCLRLRRDIVKINSHGTASSCPVQTSWVSISFCLHSTNYHEESTLVVLIFMNTTFLEMKTDFKLSSSVISRVQLTEFKGPAGRRQPHCCAICCYHPEKHQEKENSGPNDRIDEFYGKREQNKPSWIMYHSANLIIKFHGISSGKGSQSFPLLLLVASGLQQTKIPSTFSLTRSPFPINNLLGSFLPLPKVDCQC